MEKIDFARISTFIDKKLNKKSKFVICPYGSLGKKIESLLLKKGISKSNIIIADNGLSSENPKYLSIKQLGNVYDSDSVILLCSLSFSKDISKEISQYIDSPLMIDVLKIPPNLIERISTFLEKSFLSKLFILTVFYFYKISNKLFYTPSNNKIAIVLDGGLGDAIVASGLVDNLQKNGFRITYLCLPNYIDYFETAQTKDDYLIIEYRSDFALLFDKQEKKIKNRRVAYDYVIALIDFPQNKYRILNLVSKIKYRELIGINQKFFWSYDKNFNYTVSSHITKIFYDIQSIFIKDIPYSSYRYSVDILKSCKDEALEIFKKFNPQKRKSFLINCGASSSHRCISFNTLKLLLNDLQQKREYVIFLVNCNFDVSDLLDNNVHLLSFSHFGEICFFVSLVDYLITPDTSLVHIGCLYNTKSICIYNNRVCNNRIANNIIFSPGPFYDNAIQVFTDEYRETEEGDDIKKIKYKYLKRGLQKLIKHEE